MQKNVQIENIRQKNYLFKRAIAHSSVVCEQNFVHAWPIQQFDRNRSYSRKKITKVCCV